MDGYRYNSSGLKGFGHNVTRPYGSINNGLAPNNSNGVVDGGDCKNNGKKGRSFI